MANKPLKSIKFPGLSDTYTVPEVDDTLAVTGAAADAKKVGDEISDIKADLSQTEEIFAQQFDTSKSYAVGSFCIYDHKLYVCKTAIISGEAFDVTHWQFLDVFSIVDNLTNASAENVNIDNYTTVDGKFMKTNGSTANADTFEYVYFPVSAGHVLSVTAATGQQAALWVLKNESGAVVSYSTDTSAVALKTETVSVAVDGTLYVSNRKDKGSISITENVVRLYLDLSSAIYDGESFSNVFLRIPSAEFIALAKNGTYTAYANDGSITETDNKFMYSNGGLVATNVSEWHVLSFPIVDGTKTIQVQAFAGQAAPLWVLKDASGTVLGYSADISMASLKTEIIDLTEFAGAKTLYVNDKKSNNHYILYTVENALVLDLAKSEYGEETFYSIYQKIMESASELTRVHSSNNLYQKTLCTVGDSITQGADMDSDGITYENLIDVYTVKSSSPYTWNKVANNAQKLKTYGYQIAERNNMTFYNGGISGSMMQASESRNGFSNENGRYTLLPTNMDYLVIFFGWNDSAYGTLGTIDDTTNATFYGAYNVVMPYIIENHPDTKIVVVVPFGTTPEMREAVRLIANKWGVACFDMYQGGTPLYYGKEESAGVDPDIVTLNRTRYQANGAHPNFKGHKQIADMLEHFIRGI